MLARNFLTAEQLAISGAEHNALTKVLGMLERGELEHTQGGQIENGFNMHSTAHNDCGTCCCIGGWAAILMSRHPNDYVYSKAPGNPLHPLYWHRTSPLITTAQAAVALRNFLVTGKPNWDEALSS